MSSGAETQRAMSTWSQVKQGPPPLPDGMSIPAKHLWIIDEQLRRRLV